MIASTVALDGYPYKNALAIRHLTALEGLSYYIATSAKSS
jgi:hypothetical protein